MELGLANYLGVSEKNIHLYWKGRVGLYAVLRGMDIGEGDEVVIPAFTCVVVANAIIYCGAKPVYVDVNPENFCFDSEGLSNAISVRTKLVIAQNTFGIPPDYETLESVCSKWGIPCVEDCTHGLGTLYQGKKLPPQFVIASFYSFQWNKPLSSGLGGMVFCRDNKLNEKLITLDNELIQPALKTKFFLSVLLKVRPLVDQPLLYWPLLKTYRFLSKIGLVIGSSSGGEISSTAMPADFFMAITKLQKRTIDRKISGLDDLIQLRKRHFLRYTAILEQITGQVSRNLPEGHSALKFPILVKDKSIFEAKAEKAGVKLGDWMCSPIHPVKEDWYKWHYSSGQAENAEWLSARILNLQTELSEREMKRTIAFLKDNRSDIIAWTDKAKAL